MGTCSLPGALLLDGYRRPHIWSSCLTQLSSIHPHPEKDCRIKARHISKRSPRKQPQVFLSRALSVGAHFDKLYDTKDHLCPPTYRDNELYPGGEGMPDISTPINLNLTSSEIQKLHVTMLEQRNDPELSISKLHPCLDLGLEDTYSLDQEMCDNNPTAGPWRP